MNVCTGNAYHLTTPQAVLSYCSGPNFLSTCYKPGHFYETRRSILTCVSELLRIDYILTNNRDNCHARHYFFRVETAEQLLSLCNPTYSGHAWLGDHDCGVLRNQHNESICRWVNYHQISSYIYFFKICTSGPQKF